MSEYIKVNGIQNLPKALERGAKKIRKQCDAAVWKTARDAVRPIRKRVPIAFGELSASVQAYQRGANGHAVTSVDAPHAGAVEIGSPPHKPNFERLLAWVKLRGLQHLGGGPRKRGPTSGYQVPRIGSMFAAHVQNGSGGSFSPSDTAEKVARAISKGIEKHGTKPHWFVRESLPEIRQILDENMKKAKTSSAGGGGSSSGGGGKKSGSSKGKTYTPRTADEWGALGKVMKPHWDHHHQLAIQSARKNFGHDK